jgi:hypothetical protein
VLYRGQVAATADTNQASLDQSEGTAAEIGGGIKGVGTLLTGWGKYATSQPSQPQGTN